MSAAEQGDNPFVQPFDIPGVGQATVPAPAFTSSGGFAPGITQGARKFAEESSNAIGDYLAKRNLTSSSFLPTALSRSYQGGFREAANIFQQQQQIYAGLSAAQMNMMAQSAGGPGGGGGGALGGALGGAGLGGYLGAALPGAGLALPFAAGGALLGSQMTADNPIGQFLGVGSNKLFGIF